MRRQYFDGDVAVQARIACAVNFTHPTSAGRSDNLVGAQVSS